MLSRIDLSRLQKLPLWARQTIDSLVRENQYLTDTLEAINDASTGAFYYSPQTLGTPHHIDTHIMEVEHDDVHLRILTPLDRAGIELLFDHKHGLGQVMILPQATNCLRLVKCNRS